MTPRTRLSEGGPIPGDDAPWSAFARAAAELSERRRAQRGTFTYGDDHDRELARALAHVRIGPAEAAMRGPLVEEVGDALGRDVYARRMFEDSFRGAFVTLSASLTASGFGALEVEESFHRSARARFRPAPALLDAAPDTRDRFLCGLLRGFMSEAFNCDATVAASGDGEGAFEVTLGAGRDANARRREP